MIRFPSSRLSASEADALWLRFRSTRDPRLRDRLIERYILLAKSIALRMVATLNTVFSGDDAIAFALKGLIEAVDRYDPERGIPFEPYAKTRIRGAIIDGLRTMDMLPRSERRRVRAEGVDVNPLSLDELRSGNKPIRIVWPDVVLDPERDAAVNDRNRLLRGYISALPAAERDVVTQYFYEDRTLRAIGETRGVGESRACQILSSGIRRLRAVATKDREALLVA